MPASSSPRLPWIVRRSSIHSRGVFATEDIPADTKVIEYVGEKITKAESGRRGKLLMKKASKTGCAAVYIFTINKKYDLDGDQTWNPARLINHSCDPNCEAFIIRGRIWIYSKREIKKGEELSFNYGFDMETWDDHPCRCGSPKCVGYILDEQFWPKLRSTLKAMETRRENKIAALEKRALVLKKELELMDKKGSAPAKPAPKKAMKLPKATRPVRAAM